ncbi:zinc finger domain-containing protein [Mycobacterium antarcticum]|nr:hypothetical protein TUM20984_50080 [Mycolicibacterium sp. TUM20984]
MTTTVHAALSYDCPFCKAPAGHQCRTRNSGREQPWPHSRRIARSTPSTEERYKATRLNALCCVCGNHRTVSSNHYTSCADPNSAHNEANCQRSGNSPSVRGCPSRNSSTLSVT